MFRRKSTHVRKHSRQGKPSGSEYKWSLKGNKRPIPVMPDVKLVERVSARIPHTSAVSALNVRLLYIWQGAAMHEDSSKA
ncbi:hypothetical protein TRAPUB_4780 [Trametes pubescens]|uniref:Uncharacterized protein n=1 Tax=Trametes pubescens TaxID=154538 RepID=A0A1M2VA29_TRAPU|nr:hypothetical protein TRAPUB_4780 [Trametes pubescens]